MDESSHQRRRFPLHPGEGMRVHVHNEGHVGVAEAQAHVDRVNGNPNFVTQDISFLNMSPERHQPSSASLRAHSLVDD